MRHFYYRYFKFTLLVSILLITSCKNKQLEVGNSAFFKLNEYGGQDLVADSTYTYPETVILYIINIKGFKQDEKGLIYPNMDIEVQDINGQNYFVKDAYYKNDQGIELTDGLLPFMYGVWQPLPTTPKGIYKFKVRIYDTKSKKEHLIEKAFIIR